MNKYKKFTKHDTIQLRLIGFRFCSLRLCQCLLCSYPAHGHLIGGQRAGLVGADDRCTAKGLHRRQTADNCILLGHAPSSQSQASSDDSRQTWRETATEPQRKKRINTYGRGDKQLQKEMETFIYLHK